MEFTKEISEDLQSKPIEVQIRQLIEYVDNEKDLFKNKDNYLKFEELLKQIKIANKAVGVGSTNEEFYQLRVDYVLKMRAEKEKSE